MADESTQEFTSRRHLRLGIYDGDKEVQPLGMLSVPYSGFTPEAFDALLDGLVADIKKFVRNS